MEFDSQAPNPLREGLRLERTPDPCSLIVFGASGDLTRRKLVPALYSLARQSLLPSGFSLLGTARTEMSHAEFRSRMREAVDEFFEGPRDASVWENCQAGMYYCPADSDDEASFHKLAKQLKEIEKEHNTGENRLFYFATPPSLYVPLLKMLAQVGLSQSDGWVRVIIEKPFGHDLASMRQLNRQVLEVFQEDQVYRIDHYLGKETVQNIMVLRFANGIFEPLWDRRYVDHVQITAAESLGVESRGGYYERAGALRDMIQNHLFQVLTLVAMEPPSSLDPNAVRDEKTKVVRAIRPIAAQEVDQFSVRGQYAAGAVDGKVVAGYLEEEGVDPESHTETYAAVKLLIENWRWAGVPFYLRSGKRLPKRATEVSVQFRLAPHLLFDGGGGLQTNTLTLRLQPDEGISLRFGVKLPGQAFQVRPVNMDFCYGGSFAKKPPPAYERLLLDAMLGDSTLFARGDMVEACWRLLDPILQNWQDESRQPPLYESGSWGPSESHQFMKQDGRRWRRL